MQFEPQRFLERTYSPFEYLPFGGGHRHSLGAAFAIFETDVMLGTLLKHFDIERLEIRPMAAKRRSVTMERPFEGLLGPSSFVWLSGRLLEGVQFFLSTQ